MKEPEEIPDGWRPTTIGAEVDFLTGFPFTSASYTEAEDGIRLVRGDNVVQGAIRWDGVKKWPKADLADCAAYQLMARDVVLAMDRPWIEAGLKFAALTEFDLPALLVQRVARMRGGENLDTRFLKYIIKSHAFTQHVLAVQTGTAVPHISGKQIKEFGFLRPPIEEQRAIARVLGDLDDKIELNRRMNATLEAMAQALFRSWFVEFDPVRTKAEGGIPEGMDVATATLFPDTLIESDFGEIPTGWQVGVVEDIAGLGRESINPGAYPDEIFAHHSLPAFDEGRLPRAEAGATILSQKLLVTENCVLLSKLNPRFPRCWLPHVKPNSCAIASTEFLVLCPKAGFTREYIYGLFTSKAFNEIFATFVTGTSGSHQRVQPSSLVSMPVALPPPKLVDAFTDKVSQLFAKSEALRLENRQLAAVRDDLLVQLLSGELRIPEPAEVATT